MITDYSGIIFDYAFVFEKPLICADTKFDSSPYDAAWFNEECWTFKILPEIATILDEKDFPNIKTLIDSMINDQSLIKNRKKVRDESWINIGKSAELTVDYLIGKNLELNSKEA